jgi:hypothetical protein
VTDEMEAGEENNVRHYEIYQQFIGLFEVKLETFIIKKGYSISEFYEKMAKVNASQDDWSDESMFLNLVSCLFFLFNFLFPLCDTIKMQKHLSPHLTHSDLLTNDAYKTYNI